LTVTDEGEAVQRGSGSE